MRALTDRQEEIFRFILEHYRDHGAVPDYPSLQEAFGFTSANSVYQHLSALVKKNYLVKLDHGTYDLHQSRFSLLEEDEPGQGLPIRGRIAAGGMHEAVSADLGHLPVELVSWRSPRLFALQVMGDSMRDAGIRDGDYIILDQKEPSNGDIGAVLYNGETTLKRIFQWEDEIELRPENDAYKPIHIRPEEWEEVTVFGTYVGRAWREDGEWGLLFRP
ncbi:MAG: transcriptional repressor LexA [Balneolaceae bacterium]|nr:transcriptional repressor LexA [Balneolaceae bacterium]